MLWELIIKLSITFSRRQNNTQIDKISFILLSDWFFREKERQRKGESGRETLIDCLPHMSWQGTKPETPPTNWATPARDSYLFFFFYKRVTLRLYYVFGQKNSSKTWETIVKVYYYTQTPVLIRKYFVIIGWNKGCIICASQFLLILDPLSLPAAECTLTRRSQDYSMLTEHRMLFSFSQRIWLNAKGYEHFQLVNV